MRVDSISIGPPDDPAVIQFHPRFTMVAGVGAPERAEVVDLVVAALTADGPDLQAVTYVDNTGRTITMRRDAAGTRFVDEDGNEVPSPLSVLGLSADELRRTLLVDASDLLASADADAPATVETTPNFPHESPELTEARATLAAVEAELAEASDVKVQAQARRAEAAVIDADLLAARDDGARRQYARLLAELERVRAEAAVVKGGAAVADADRRFIESANGVRRLATHWREADDSAAAERTRFSDHPRLDADALAEALSRPDEVPAELQELARRYEAAEARRVDLDTRLRRAGAETVAEPAHPAIVRLAHADQELVWATARRALELAQCLEGHSMDLGGLGPGNVAATAAADLDTAHDAVEQAERDVAAKRVPGFAAIATGLMVAVLGILVTPILLGAGVVSAIVGGVFWLVLPRQRVRAALVGEQEALERAGVPSYLGLQYRRLEATLNPKVTETLQQAAADYDEALATWRGLGGDVGPAEALDLEAETRQYVASLSQVQGVSSQLEQLRAELVQQAEPAVEQARQHLMTACRPFGVSDPVTALELAHGQARTSALARGQRQLERAESVAAELRTQLDAALTDLGFVGDDDLELGQRLVAFETARRDACQRDEARATARPAEQVEADLAALEARARTEHRPEWGTNVAPADIDEPDVDVLQQRRQTLLAEANLLDRKVFNVERLADRRDAMRRRVVALGGTVGFEASAGAGGGATIDAPGLEDRLLARLTTARRAGPVGETAPLVLNEPFTQMPVDRKRKLLDTLERLSAAVQLTYLTNDPEVIAWGRTRAATGAISLLEPANESATC